MDLGGVVLTQRDLTLTVLLLGSEKTKEALLELKAALENNPKMVAHYPVEVRFARGDGIWLSPCFQRDSCYMNIIMYR